MWRVEVQIQKGGSILDTDLVDRSFLRRRRSCVVSTMGGGGERRTAGAMDRPLHQWKIWLLLLFSFPGTCGEPNHALNIYQWENSSSFPLNSLKVFSELIKFRVFSDFLLLIKFRENNSEKNSEKTREQCCLSRRIISEYHSEFILFFRLFTLN
jgi:hypothetical protein